jgi:hopanoid biosynthesis associated RND transporter like protein HpnN
MNLQLLNRIEGTLWAWMSFVMRHPVKMIAALIALALLGLVLAMNGLGVNSDTSRMVSSKLDYRKAQIDFEAAFPKEEIRVALIIRARSDDEADAFAAKISEVLRGRTDVVSDVFAATADPFLVENGLLFLETSELDEILGGISAAAPILKRLGREPDMTRLYLSLADAIEPIDPADEPASALVRAMDAVSATVEKRKAGVPEPLSWQAIFRSETEDGSPDLHQRIISITPVLDLSRLQPARPAVLAIDQAINEVVAASEFDISASITGNAVLRTEELASVTEGIGVSLALSALFIIVLLMIALRSAVLVATSILALVITILITAGFAAIFYDALNLVSVAFMVLLVGLGIDFMIHLALHVQEERTIGRGCRAALFKSNRHIGAALALCAPTSAIAFFAFAPTQFTGMTQLGIVSGFGVLVAFIVAVTLLPAVLALLPPNSGVRLKSGVPSGYMSKLSIEGPWQSRVAMATIALGGLSLFLLPYVRFDADPMALRDPDAPSVQAFNLLFDDEDTQPYNLSLLLPDAAAVDDISPVLEALPEVRRVLGPADLVPEDQDYKLDAIDIAAFGLESVFGEEAIISDAAQAGAEARLVTALSELEHPSAARLLNALQEIQQARIASLDYESAIEGDIFRFWGQQYDRLEKQIYPQEITFDALPELLSSQFVASDGRLRLQIEPEEDLRDKDARQRFVEAVRAVAPQAAGSARSVLESGRVISRAMVIAIIYAWFAVAGLLFFILRDRLLVGVILLTLLLAGVLTAAMSVVIGVPFNFANVIAVPLLVGVGADSGIHLGIRARRSRDPGQIYETSTPRAVFFSAITTVCSFGTLMLSAHRGVASMGILLTIAIGFTLICTILVQPWLLNVFDRKRLAGS